MVRRMAFSMSFIFLYFHIVQQAEKAATLPLSVSATSSIERQHNIYESHVRTCCQSCVLASYPVDYGITVRSLSQHNIRQQLLRHCLVALPIVRVQDQRNVDTLDIVCFHCISPLLAEPTDRSPVGREGCFAYKYNSMMWWLQHYKNNLRVSFHLSL